MSHSSKRVNLESSAIMWFVVSICVCLGSFWGMFYTTHLEIIPLGGEWRCLVFLFPFVASFLGVLYASSLSKRLADRSGWFMLFCFGSMLVIGFGAQKIPSIQQQIDLVSNLRTVQEIIQDTHQEQTPLGREVQQWSASLQSARAHQQEISEMAHACWNKDCVSKAKEEIHILEKLGVRVDPMVTTYVGTYNLVRPVDEALLQQHMKEVLGE